MSFLLTSSPQLLARISLAICFVALSNSHSIQSVEAAPPRVGFDTSNVLSCLDITDDEFRKLHPGERLIEANFEISAMLVSGTDSDLLQFTYQIHSPSRSMQVADYSPRTEMHSSYATNISMEEKKEKNANAGLHAAGNYDFIVRSSADASLGSKSTTTTRYEKHPDQEVLLSSGTVHRNTGVYYKLQATRQTTLLGSKEFTIQFRVPENWRGGFVHLHTTARGMRRGVVSQLNEELTIAATHFTIALFLAGDLTAKVSATRFADSRESLLKTARDQEEAIKKNSYPTAIDKLGNLLAISKPRIPTDWLSQVMGTGNLESYSFRLPRETRMAAKDYLSAREQLLTLSH